MSIFSAKPIRNRSDRPATTPPSLALYVGGVLVQLAGLVAVAYQISEPIFAYFTIGLTLMGATIAYVMRKRGTSPRLLRLGTLLLGLLFLYVLRGSGFFGAVLPFNFQMGSQELLLVSALAFCATFSTFLWLSDEAVVFSCVWAIAMIGLTGTLNVNRELILCFIAFLAAAVFVLIHQNTLSQSTGFVAVDSPAPQDAAAPVRRGPGGVLRAQLIAAVIAWFGALLLGFVIAIPVQMVGKNLSLAAVIQRLKVPPTQVTRRAGRPRLSFDNLQNFVVGIGPVDDDPTERLFVLSEAPHYWRGRTFDQYNGHGWGSSLSPGVELTPAERNPTQEDLLTFNLPAREPTRQAVRRYTHRYRLVSSGGGGPLYHAAEPRQVRAGSYTIFRREDNTVGGGRVFTDEYEVSSDIAEPTPGQLRASKADYPEDVRVRYLLQGTDNEMLAVLAREALAGTNAKNPYDKAQAIRRFIANRCMYTREARAVPTDRDTVDFFLNESREGYCDLYATAMTVLCRYAGIPARVATGFAPGSVAPSDLIASQNLKTTPGDARQWYVLRGSDMHAWCEVYFDGYGWIPYDATIDTGALTPQATPQPVAQKSAWQDLLRRGLVPLVLVGLGCLGLVYVAANELWTRFFGGPRSRVSGPVTASAVRADALSRVYYKTARQIGKQGPRLDAAMTPDEYREVVGRELSPVVAEAFAPLVRALETASYSAEGLSDEQLRQAKAVPKSVRAALRSLPRRPKQRHRPKENAHASDPA